MPLRLRLTALAAALPLLAAAAPAHALTVGSCHVAPGAQCAQANLQNAQLKGVNLSGANLEGANLIGAQLQGANLSGARLNHAVLHRANLDGANLNAVHGHTADLSYVIFGAADLRHAILDHANLHGSQLGGADLRSARLVSATTTATNFVGANLQHATFHGAKAQGANFHSTSLNETSFVDANVDGASFVGAHFSSTHMTGASAHGTHLFPSTFKDDQTARNALYRNVYVHIDGYYPHGSCDTTGRTMSVSSDGGTSCRGKQVGDADLGSRGSFFWKNDQDASKSKHFVIDTDGAYFAGTRNSNFGTLQVESLHLTGAATPAKVTAQAPGTPGGPLAMQLTYRDGFEGGYLLRAHGWFVRPNAA